MESAARLPVGTAADTQVAILNTEMDQLDVNSSDRGKQRFIFKKILDAGVGTSIGSPVGEVQGTGGGTVTPDQSDVGAGAILHGGGGIAQFAVAAGTTSYGWVQRSGIGRTVLKTTGALAAGALGYWSGDDTVVVYTAGTHDAYVFVMALVVAASGSVPAGGYRLLD